MASFAITVGLFLTCSYVLHLFPASILYDNLGDILGCCNVFALLFCVVLYLKGRFAPSTPDHGLSGNPIFDYYWGTELYPNIFGWDVKRFTNCRFGMMGWPLLLLSYAAKQQELYGLSDSMLVAVGIQLVYTGGIVCCKFMLIMMYIPEYEHRKMLVRVIKNRLKCSRKMGALQPKYRKKILV